MVKVKKKNIHKARPLPLCVLQHKSGRVVHLSCTLQSLDLNHSHFLLFKVEEAMMVLEDDPPMEAASTPSTPRNLSAWNITIPYIDFYDDDVKRERIPVFCIDVERNDRKAGEAVRTFIKAYL